MFSLGSFSTDSARDLASFRLLQVLLVGKQRFYIFDLFTRLQMSDLKGTGAGQLVFILVQHKHTYLDRFATFEQATCWTLVNDDMKVET